MTTAPTTRPRGRRRSALLWAGVIVIGGCASAPLQGCSDTSSRPMTSASPPSLTDPSDDPPTDTTSPTGSADEPADASSVESSPTRSTQLPTETSTATSGTPADTTSATAGPAVIDDAPDLTPPTLELATVTFPLGVDRGLLVDHEGEPFLVHGDAAWSMLVQLDPEATDTYLARRREQGFNTLLVNLIEHNFSDDPPRNHAGDDPFLAPGDFSRPNPAYFEAAHESLERAADAGFLVLLAPAYLGFGGGDEGWYLDMVAAGPDALREYGRFVGERFGDLDNVIWVQGGDFTPPSEHIALVEAVRNGLLDAGAPQLHTAHWSPEDSSADVAVDWLDLNMTYTYGPVYVKSSADNEIDEFPHVVLESQYEDDIWDNTRQRLRAQVYEPMLTGALGSVYGHGAVWQYSADWREALEAPGANYMMHGRSLFDSLPWTTLDPDVRDGNLISDVGDFGWESVVVAAATPDRSVVVAYVPDARDLTVVLGDVSGSVAVRWFDPVNGRYCAADAQLTDGELTVRHPGRNADDGDDWVLDVRTQPD